MRGPMDSARSRAVISFGLPSRSTVMPAWLARYFGSRNFLSAPSRWSSKMSAMATSSTFSLPVSRSMVACVPRPPQPTSPARSFSFPAPRTRWGWTIVNAAAPAVSKERREIGFEFGVDGSGMMPESYSLAAPVSMARRVAGSDKMSGTLMIEPTDALSAASPVARALYEELLHAPAPLGAFETEVKKTSIHLVRSSAFAGVHPRKQHLLITIKAAAPIPSGRIVKTEQVSKNRWHLD